MILTLATESKNYVCTHLVLCVPFIIVEHVLCGIAMVNIPIHYHNTAERNNSKTEQLPETELRVFPRRTSSSCNSD